MKKVLQNKDKGLGFLRHWKVMTMTLLLLTFSISQMWADTFTAAEIAAKSGSENVGTTKNHVTVSLPGITATSNVNYAKISGTQKKRDMVEVSGKATSGSITTDKVLSIKVDRGYKLVSPVKINGSSSSTSDIKMAYVGWQGQPEASFQLCNGATDWKFDKNSITSEPVDREIAFATTIRAIYLYTQIKTATDSYNSFGTSKTVGSGTKAYVYTVDASAVLAPEIEGESQMWNNETIELVGYPTGGAWAVVSGPGSIASDGKLTANGNGTIRVSYTVDAVSGIKDIVAGTTKQYTWLFNTNNVMPTTIGITAQKSGGSFESQGQLKLGSNGDYAYIDLTSLNYLVTAAVINGKTGSTGDGKNIGFGSAASNTQDGTTADATESTYTDYAVTPTKSSSIFSVIKTSGTSTYIASITLTVQKAVACTAAPTVSAATKGTTTSTTQVVNCAGISSLGSEGCSISSYGFVYGTGETPNIDDDTPVEVGTSYSTINTAFAETTLTGLTPSTTYYVRAYATNGFGTAYGSAVSFTTSAACTVAPTVSTISKGTTSYTTQVMNCAGVTAIGSAGCAISSYGFVYGTAEHPTTENSTKEVGTSYTVVETAFAETTLTGLTPNTTYYVRAYATNEYGTAYSSNELSFTTLETIGNVAFIASSTSVTNDAITALRDAGYNVTVRTKAAEPNYTGVDLVVLDESLGWDSSSDEVGTVIGVNVPILNLKAFFYTLSNRWNWGTPVNPSPLSETATLSTVYTNISSHPIFDGVTITAGAVDMVNPSKSGNNLQGVTTSTLVEGKKGYTLATSASGTTCIHELTPAQRGVLTAKYLLIALSSNIKDNYSDDAKKMIVNAAKYLIGNTAWVPVIAPTLSSSVPANNATDVAVEGNIVLTFSENVTVLDASKFTLSGGAGSLTTASISVSGAAVTIPYTGLDNSTEYTLATAAGAVKNGSDVPNAALSNIVFTTEAACTKPGSVENLAASNLAYTTADLSWDAADNSDGYKISIIKKDDESVIVGWTDNATTSYAATDLTQGTEYTFKVKAKGVTGYCEFGLEATVDFTTTAPSVADLVTIADDYTFTPSATIAAGTLAEVNKLFASGANDCDYNGSGMRIKENRALAFNVNNGAKVKVTFGTNGDREMKLGTAMTGDDSKVYGHSKTSPVTFDVTADGVVYLTSTSDLRFTKMEIMYPHTVTYDLNGGMGDPVPTQASKYVGETFTAHDGVTGITAPATKEFDKWVDQDAADVAAGTTYTMPAKAVTLTAQWVDYIEPVDPTLTYDDGAYSVGGSALDLSTLITAQTSTGAITYSVKTDGGTSASVDGNNFTATAAGTATITASQAAVVGFNAKSVDFNVVVTEPSEVDGVKLVEAGALTGNYITSSTLSTDGAPYVVEGLSYSKYIKFGGTFSGSYGNGARNNYLIYDLNKQNTTFYMYVHNNSGTEYKIVVYAYDNASSKLTEIPVAGSANALKSFSLNDVTENTRVFIGVNNTNIYFCQVVAVESGDDLLKGGQAGYAIDFGAKSRFAGASGETITLDGMTFVPSGGYAPNNSTEVALGTIGTNYVKFVLPTAAEVQVTTNSTNKYYIGSTYASDQATSKTYEYTPTAAKEMHSFSLAAGTWYLNPNTSNIKLTKLAFIAPKCAEPTITPMSNSDLCEGDDFAALAVSASVSDGGTLHYQWYKHPTTGDDEAVGTDAASYTPEADGQYYVVVTNRLADHSDNSATSNTITVTHFAAAVITTAPLNQRGEVGDVVTLTVAATGKNVAYKWYTCDEDGGNEVALDPAETGTSINVTITAGLLQWYKVKVTSDCGGAEAKAKVSEFVPTTPANVTESIVWDWESSAWPASGQVAFTAQVEDGTDLTPAYELLADADAIVPNNAAFRSDMLYGKGQWVWRSGNKFFQGTAIKFTTEVAGLVRVNYRSTGNNKEVQVTIAGTPAGKNKTSNFKWSEYVEVPAGAVEILCLATDENKSLTRVQKIEFLALENRRTAGWIKPGELGTVCLENTSIVEGATIYELQGPDQYGKLVFDEVQSGEVVAGTPYLFEATATGQISFYKKVNAAHADEAGELNGMHGTFSGETFSPSDGNAANLYYFSGNAIWCVANRSTSANIPAHGCYLNMEEFRELPIPSPTPAPGRRRITLGVNGKNTPTGLENGELINGENGVQKVLINGELFILRGEKMYDATGRLVK